jgi:hypothetical protein
MAGEPVARRKCKRKGKEIRTDKKGIMNKKGRVP